MKKLLIQYKSEKDWFEFKENWFDVHIIGEYISALSNAAVLTGKQMEAKIGVGSTTIQKSIAFLKNNGWITRMGSNKTGYWRIEK